CLMLPHIPGCELVFVTCSRPSDVVLDYYAGLWPVQCRDSARRRLHIVEVPDPSPRPVAEKLLEHDLALQRIRRIIGKRPAMIEPWNVTAHEVYLALALDVPINGTPPDLWPLGFKSAGRRLLRESGVPVPEGREDVRDRAGVSAAIDEIRRLNPHAA